jgi:hypothetical protein
MPLSDHDLMRIEADTGFTYDARGRMLLSNEPRETARKPAQRLYLGRTRMGHVARFRADVPDDVAQQIEESVAREPLDGDLSAPPAEDCAIRAGLARHAPASDGGSGPAYCFPDSIASLGEAVRITADTRDLVRETFPWLHTAYHDWWPAFAVLHDGAGVSVCFSSRIGPRAMAAGTFTLPEYRGRGYAAIATASWGAAVRATGRIPFYGTSWDNLSSQGVARRAGLIMYGATTTWT